MAHNLRIGKKGEQRARTFLEAQGYQFLTTNYFCKWGEVDLIFKDPYTQEIVFAEVKTRKNKKYGGIFSAISSQKRNCVERTALDYLEKKELSTPYRIDGIFVCQGEIEHERNI